VSVRVISVRRVPAAPRPRPRRTVGAIAWGYAGLVAAYAFAIWTMGDRWWPFTLLLYGPRWALGLPLPPLVLWALLRDRRALRQLALASVMLLGPVLGLRIGVGRFFGGGGQQRFRVVTANLDGGRPSMPEALRDLHPDLLLLQECGRELPPALVAEFPGWYFDTDSYSCFLSRWPVEDRAKVDPGPFWARGGAMVADRYRIRAPFGTFSVTNLHLATPRGGLQDAVRLRFWLSGPAIAENTDLRDDESHMGRSSFDKAGGPALAGGDFNMPVESAIYRRYWGDLTNAFSAAGMGFGSTKFTRFLRIRIDHVLASPEWHIDHAEVGPDIGSDHRPMVVDLHLRR
jgi:vancomycin resistance protein VanJ